jgi:restriction system protein
MSESEPTIWTIRGGRAGEADSLFLKKNRVGLGWELLTDLRKIGSDREAFKAAVSEKWPEKTPASVANNAGQLYRFVYEVEIGDVVLYPSKVDRQIHIGRITGPYVYDPGTDPDYPHTRPVKWLRAIPRTHFTQGALYEINSAMSFFTVKHYGDEVLAALDGKATPQPAVQDETVQLVAEDIEENTQDFILKQLSRELKGHPFAEFVAHLLETMGYRTRLSPEGPDGGIDIIAHRDELGFEPPIIKVQVKSTDGSVGDPVVSALYGKVSVGEFGLLAALGTFTSQATTFARSKSNLRLIGGEDLVKLVLQHYEKLDSRYKGLIPLKRVYIPETLDETNQ